MVTVDNVCIYCKRELLKGNIPGNKVAPGCLSPVASHGCCTGCLRVESAKLEAYRKELENEKLQV